MKATKMRFLPILALSLLTVSARAQVSGHIATTEQKLKFAKAYISEKAEAMNLSLVEGSLDIYPSNGPMAVIKPLPDLAYSIARQDLSGKLMDVEYVKFLLMNSAGEKFAGWINITTSREAGNLPQSMNPVTGRPFFYEVGHKSFGIGGPDGWSYPKTDLSLTLAK